MSKDYGIQDPRRLETGQFISADDRAFFEMRAREHARDIVTKRFDASPTFGLMVVTELFKLLSDRKGSQKRQEQPKQEEQDDDTSLSRLFG